MKKLFTQSSHKKIVLTCLFALLCAQSTFVFAQTEKKTESTPAATEKKSDVNPAAPISMEEPSPLYLVMMKQWATSTNYAAESANLIVKKLKLSMEQDPELKKIMTPAFMADLEQFIYELFVSNDAISALAKVYSQYFTIDEMQDLLAFYNTPLGKKLTKAEPELVIKTQEVGLNLLKKNQRAYMEMVAKYAGKPVPPKPEAPQSEAPPPAEEAPVQPFQPPVEAPKPVAPEVQPVKPAEPPKALEPVKPIEVPKTKIIQPDKSVKPEKPLEPQKSWWERLLSMIGVKRD